MYESVEEKELSAYLSNPDIRHLYLDYSIRHLLAMQLRSMREARGLGQVKVGENAGGMKQSAIARLEDPRYSSMTLSTLKRLAKAFDVALLVRFASFSEFISWTTQLNEAQLSPPSFIKEQLHVVAPVSVATNLGEDTKDVNANNLSLPDFKLPDSKIDVPTANTVKKEVLVNA